jgi:predicted transcriptional regulator
MSALFFPCLIYYKRSRLIPLRRMKVEKRIFGELELAILSVFQKERSAYTVRDVLGALGRDDKYTTIMTVMNRLVAKGELHRERVGLSYRYVMRTQKPRIGLIEKWRRKIFGGNSALMISYLLKSGEDITKEELLQIEQLIDQAKRRIK